MNPPSASPGIRRALVTSAPRTRRVLFIAILSPLWAFGRPTGDTPVPRPGWAPDAAFRDGRRRLAGARLEPAPPGSRYRAVAHALRRHGPVQLLGLSTRGRKHRPDQGRRPGRHGDPPARLVRLRLEPQGSARAPDCARRSGALLAPLPCACPLRSGGRHPRLAGW